MTYIRTGTNYKTPLIYVCIYVASYTVACILRLTVHVMCFVRFLPYWLYSYVHTFVAIVCIMYYTVENIP